MSDLRKGSIASVAAGAALTAIGIFLASGCINEVDPQAVTTGDGGDTPDWTTYAGLHIYAHEWQTSANGERYLGYGPVDIVLFQNAVVSECYGAITGELKAQYGGVCDGISIDAPLDNSSGALCAYALCVQQVSLCAGYKNLELADAVDAVEFSVKPLTIKKDYPTYTPPGGTYRRGRVEVRHVVVTDPDDGSIMKVDLYPVRYKVPPQAPGDRTLLYESAMEFFRAAGIVSGKAFEAHCLNPAETRASAWSALPAASLSTSSGAGSAASIVSPRELGLAGFQEAVLRFNDALERLVRNENEVSGIGGAQDVGDHQTSRWNGEVNSRLSALRRVYGDLNEDAAEEGLPVVLTPLDDAVRSAVDLLRASGVDIDRTPPPSGRVLATEALQLMHEDRESILAAAADADAGTDAGDGGTEDGGCPSDATDEAELPPTRIFTEADVDRYLADNGLTDFDFTSAAQYLREEAAVLDRPPVPAETTPSGIRRSFAHSAAAENPASVVRKISHSTSFLRESPATMLDSAFAQQGAVQAFQFFRDAARMPTSDEVTADEQLLLDRIVAEADAIAGSTTVRFTYSDCDCGKCRVTVEVFDPPFAETDPSKQFAALIEGRAGLECATKGVLGAHRCGALPGSVMLARDGTWTDIDTPGGERRGFRLQPAELVNEDVELYVQAGDGINPPETVGSSVVKAPPEGSSDIAEESSSGGLADDLVSSIAGIRPYYAGTPMITCGRIREDYVPPLENELTADSDPYENSWRHYLDSAEQLATEADSLGQQMLDRGLRMDQMTEEAEGQLREICGDVGAVTEGDAPSAAAQQCYEFHPVTVSLGGPACFWEVGGRQCQCPSEGDYDVPDTICTVPCPMPADAALTDETGESWCGDKIRHFAEPDGVTRGDPADAGELPVAITYVGTALNIFPAQDDAVPAAADCEKVYAFRCLVEDIWNRRTGCAAADFSPIDLSVHGDTTRFALDDLWREVATQTWMAPSNLRRTAETLRFDASQFNNFTASAGSRVLWSTTVSGPSQPCTNFGDFFRWARRKGRETRPALPNATCHQSVPSPLHQNAWWCDQYAPPGPSTHYPYALMRSNEALPVLAAIQGAQLLGDFEPNVAIDHHVLAGSVADAGSYPEDLRGLAMLVWNDDACQSGACNCAVYDRDASSWSDCARAGLSAAEGLASLDDGSLESSVGVCAREAERLNFQSFLDARTTSSPLPSGVQDNYLELMQDLASWLVSSEAKPLPEDAHPAWLTSNSWSDFDRDAVLDGLELACYLAENGVSCDDFDPRSMPTVRTAADLGGVRRYLECTGETIAKNARSIVIQGVPEELVTAIQRSGMDTYFPGVQGAKLEAYLKIDASIASFRSEADELSSILFQMGERLELYGHQVDQSELRGQIAQIQGMIASIQTAAQAAASAATSWMPNNWGGAVANAFAPVILILEDQIRDLEAEAVDAEVASLTSQLMMDIGTSLDRLRQVSEGVAQSARDVQSGVGSLKLLADRARYLEARAGFELSNSADATYRINEAMRNWLATDRARYETLVTQAKDMAFVARRAIEFRLGENMRDMVGSMTLVPHPHDWVDDICTMRGMDYDHLSGRDRISSSGEDGGTLAEDAGVPDAVGTSAWDDWNGRFVGGYVGDYVRMLRLFVESYPMDFPFADGTDTVVLSLKGDLLQGLHAECERESYNHMLSTETMAPPWHRNDAACVIVDPEDSSANHCVAVTPADPALVDSASHPFAGAARIDVPALFPLLGDELPAVTQTVTGLNSGGRYALSWWAADGAPGCGIAGATYEVTVRSACGGSLGDELTSSPVTVNPVATWDREGLSFEVPADCDAVEVVLRPSVHASGGYLEPGGLLVSGWQLEEYWGPEGLAPADVAAHARTYEAVAEARLLTNAPCPDRDGSALRAAFGRNCTCSSGAVCHSGEPTSGDCAYAKDFSITLGGIESGAALSNEPISPRNFNYRIESIGVNVVGTNVHRCTAETSGEDCYGSAYLPYTLEHRGSDITVRNWTDHEVSFDMPTARIEHGKALTAEVVLTNPMTGSQDALMSTYMKSELRGRPLNGDYTISIWDTPELDWSKVEDIQLVVRYRYWTRME